MHRFNGATAFNNAMPKTRTELQASISELEHQLQTLKNELKRHMSWTETSPSYGGTGRVFDSYEDAVRITTDGNSCIPDVDKAYRSVTGIVPWKYHDTGERVHTDEEYTSSWDLPFYEVHGVPDYLYI